MPSPNALQYDTIYHIYTRGTNKENIFIEEKNYNYFLSLYEKYISLVAETYAYCLLKNHFHFLLRIKSSQDISQIVYHPQLPSRQCSKLFTAYAKSINKTYDRTGSLFQHPFGRKRITTEEQFLNVVSYIHQNPQKHAMVEDFRDWKYSSYTRYFSDEEGIIQVDRGKLEVLVGSFEAYQELHSVPHQYMVSA